MKLASYFRLLILTIVISTVFINCGKEEKEMVRGCMDVDAENFNPAAEIEDNSCTYFADAFVGNYIANDTAFFIGTNEVASTRIISFVVSRVGNRQIQTIGFELGGCEQMLNFNLSNTSFVPLEDCSEDNFIGKIEGTTFLYSYEFQINPMDRYAYRGVAIKQE